MSDAAKTEAAAKLPPRYKCVAINDEADTCACCGRKKLKRVAWLLEFDGTDPAPYGTTCAAHLLLEREPSEPKVKLSAAEKVIAAAYAETLRGFITQALELTPPAAVDCPNPHASEWNRTPWAAVGDFAKPRVSRGFDAYYSVAESEPELQRGWFLNRAVEIARASGLSEPRPMGWHGALRRAM